HHASATPDLPSFPTRRSSDLGLIASLLVAFPTGDAQAKMVGHHQPVTLASMEGKFEGGPMAPVALIGQPNVAKQRLDNPIEVPGYRKSTRLNSSHGSISYAVF